MRLGLCEGCGRFAKPDTDCPFCGGHVGAPKPRWTERRARNGVLAVAATTLLACSSDVNTPVYGAPAYGALPTDASITEAGKDATPSDAASDATQDATLDGPSAMYGGPPVDGGSG